MQIAYNLHLGLKQGDDCDESLMTRTTKTATTTNTYREYSVLQLFRPHNDKDYDINVATTTTPLMDYGDLGDEDDHINNYRNNIEKTTSNEIE